MQLGVSVVFSAVNEGPDPSQVTNVAPWGICVAASSVDRMFPTRIILYNKLLGESFITTPTKAKLADAIIYLVNEFCRPGNWIKSKFAVRRVILCFSSIGPLRQAKAAAKKANASGLIFVESVTRQVAVDIIPSVHVNLPCKSLSSSTVNRTFFKYRYVLDIIDIVSTSNVMLSTNLTALKFVTCVNTVYYTTIPRTKPVVRREASKTIIGKSPAYLSSREPSSLAPDILKPDISARGKYIGNMGSSNISHFDT
ncbi:hypothetical protein EV2_005645 [Malus domestica]